MPYAGFVTRAVALIADLVLINAVVAVTIGIGGLLFAGFNQGVRTDIGTFLAGATFWIVVVVLYFVTFWTAVGETPGMRIMGITVVSLDGGRIGVRRGVRRLLGMALCTATFGLGYLGVLFSERRRGLHDKIAGTLVLYDEDATEQLSVVPAKHQAGPTPRTDDPTGDPTD